MIPLHRSSCLFLAGPTAVGKSEVALLLAQTLGGEIISVDSMQVYRGMDIGTAKPSAVDRRRVPHHLLDALDLSTTFDAAQFVKLAEAAIEEIHARGRVPILCGGTGLYFKALLEGLGQAPASDAALRASLEATALPELLRELAERDPESYERIDRQNPRRVVRAVEVIRLTGKPFSTQRAEWRSKGDADASAAPGDFGSSGRRDPCSSSVSAFFALSRSTEDLHVRINARVEKMFECGLVAETQRLLEHGLAQNRTASQALGYRQVLEYLRNERTLPETIELVKLRSRQFAKRQMTWFRRQAQVIWVAVEPNESADSVAERIGSQFAERAATKSDSLDASDAKNRRNAP